MAPVAAPRRSRAAAASGLLLGLAILLAAAPAARADATAFATTLLRATKDVPGCGELDEPCCLKQGTLASCAAPGLACVAVSAQNPRCVACGGLYQPPCNGKKCDAGLAPFDSPQLAQPICGETARGTAIKAAKRRGAAGRGAAKPGKDESQEGAAILGACDAAANNCDAGKACVGGVCQACGGPGQPCCKGAAAPCKQFGRGGQVVCEFDAKLGGPACKNAKRGRGASA